MSEALEAAVGAARLFLAHLQPGASPAYFLELSNLVNQGATEDDEATNDDRLIEFLERGEGAALTMPYVKHEEAFKDLLLALEHVSGMKEGLKKATGRKLKILAEDKKTPPELLESVTKTKSELDRVRRVLVG